MKCFSFALQSHITEEKFDTMDVSYEIAIEK